MAHVHLRNIRLHYPLFDMSGRSLKMSAMNRVRGGPAGSVNVLAIENLSLQIEDGDRVGLVGRNGAGKSTLLRVIAGLVHPQYGQVEVSGRLVPLLDRGLGINPELSGESNIELPLRLLGATDTEIAHAKDWVPGFTGLDEFIHLPVRTYSEGMKARLAFAICTAITADILVLDEWLTAGDMLFVERAERHLKQLLGQTRILVLASHSLELLSQTCSKILWMEHGRLVMYGETKEVLAAYYAAMRQTSNA